MKKAFLLFIGMTLLPPLLLEAEEPQTARPENGFHPGVLKDVSAPQEVPSSEQVEPKAFMEIEMSQERPFVREPFAVTHRLFCTVPFQFKSFKRPSSGAGFEQLEKLASLPDAPQQEREIDGERYMGKVVSQTVWFSKEAGERLLDPGEILLVVKRHSKRLFDRSYQEKPPAGDFFATGEERTVTLSPRKIVVRPLSTAPEPEAFGGAVGNFELQAFLDKQEVEVGQSLALKVMLKGYGNVAGVKELSLGRLPFASSYSSKGSEEIKLEKGKVRIEKSYEYVLIPNQAGSHTIESVPFWYFNPRLGAYRKISTQPLSLLVKERAALPGEAAASPGASAQEPTLIGRDIYFIKTELGRIGRRQTPFYKHPFFIPLHLSPLFLLFLSGVARAYQVYVMRQELPRRQRRALRVSHGRLETARRFLNEGNPQKYAREAEAALFGYFGDKLSRSAAGFTIEALEELVSQAGGTQLLQGSLRKCVESLNAIRFASGSLSNQEVLGSYTLIRDVLLELDELDFAKVKKI